MKILLDENMPHNLVKALRAEGHDVESVHNLFVKDFITKFNKTDWLKHVHGNAWPKETK